MTRRGGPISDATKREYYLLRFGQGVQRSMAAREVGVSEGWARGFEKDLEENPALVEVLFGTAAIQTAGSEKIFSGPGPKPVESLSPPARRALDDFEYFRFRYLGVRSVPWMAEVGHKLSELWLSPDKEYALVNAHPGSGKSTLVTRDFALWLTCRDRLVRGTVGHAIQKRSTRYCNQLRRELERQRPIKASEQAMRQWGAGDAEATLVDDFGRFRPMTAGVWRDDQFLVEQVGGEPPVNKEPTWWALSMEGELLGDRIDAMLWDDAQTVKRLKSDKIREDDYERWDQEIETRLEAGGLLAVMMQRLGPRDISRHCLDKRVDLVELDVVDDATEAELADSMRKQYTHFVYKAHDETKCIGHKGGNLKPWPDGCLLNPRAFTWAMAQQVKHRRSHAWEVEYQQNDSAPEDVLVQEAWVEGLDPKTKAVYPGCWDDGTRGTKERSLGELPDIERFPKPWVSYATIDPSASNYWACEWWIYHEPTQQRFLIDFIRSKLQANEILDNVPGRLEWTGIMPEWTVRARALRAPIVAWVLEANNFNKHFFAYATTREWAKMNGVVLMPHETTGNKHDPEMGVVAVIPKLYQKGLVRLPGSPLAKVALRPLLHELYNYPDSTTDAVMAQWFGEVKLPEIARRTIPDHTVEVIESPPSWLRTVPDRPAHPFKPRPLAARRGSL